LKFFYIPEVGETYQTVMMAISCECIAGTATLVVRYLTVN